MVIYKWNLWFRFSKYVLMLIVKGQQTMVFAGILECSVRSINTGELCRPSGPEMYFICSITHRDRTYVRYWSTVMKLPLTSDLFQFYPHLNGVLLATGTKKYTNQYLNLAFNNVIISMQWMYTVCIFKVKNTKLCVCARVMI